MEIVLTFEGEVALMEPAEYQRSRPASPGRYILPNGTPVSIAISEDGRYYRIINSDEYRYRVEYLHAQWV